jgi:hypothetical protein
MVRSVLIAALVGSAAAFAPASMVRLMFAHIFTVQEQDIQAEFNCSEHQCTCASCTTYYCCVMVSSL